MDFGVGISNFGLVVRCRQKDLLLLLSGLFQKATRADICRLALSQEESSRSYCSQDPGSFNDRQPGKTQLKSDFVHKSDDRESKPKRVLDVDELIDNVKSSLEDTKKKGDLITYISSVKGIVCLTRQHVSLMADVAGSPDR